ncbi:MAG: site-specific integrase [Paracoccus sp. (in: a-proteobacteria)]|nr:site-specific integrase [Paracoccus sp. (in: a-proteobacteria)]
MEKIREIIAAHATGTTGIAERNKAKLRQLTGDREQRLIDLGDILIDEVNARLDRLSRRNPGQSRQSLMGLEEGRDVMCAIASDILLARVPRSANVTGIKLGWIGWQDGLAQITVPNVEVKGRGIDDPDLMIPLDRHASQRLRFYLDKIRHKLLLPGDEENPFLFPAQGGETHGSAFMRLLTRLMRHAHRIVGVAMNPHLYRHFVGWTWLKRDPNRLPDVQRLLGHKRLETTLAYYAEIDEALALDRWQAHLTGKDQTLKEGH